MTEISAFLLLFMCKFSLILQPFVQKNSFW